MNHPWSLIVGLLVWNLAGSCVRAQEIGPVERVVYREDPRLEAFFCRPGGEGPFPVVIYNHGGLGQAVGGDAEATCQALARAGFLGFAPMRRKTRTLGGHLDDVEAGLRHALALEGADGERIAMLGFSRGGLLTFQTALRRDDLDAIVLMAPASGRGALEAALPRASRLKPPALVLVARNDNAQADHVALARRIEGALTGAQREVRLVVYPPYEQDGHRLFFRVGDYWDDVIAHLRRHLGEAAERER